MPLAEPVITDLRARDVRSESCLALEKVGSSGPEALGWGGAVALGGELHLLPQGHFEAPLTPHRVPASSTPVESPGRPTPLTWCQAELFPW